VIKII